MAYPKLVESLIEQFTKFPGVGRRSAERMVFWVLNNPREESAAISEGILKLKDGLRVCLHCNNLSETDTCTICGDARRDRSIICVVEDHKHLLSIERTGVFKGLYHVLLGAIAPSEGRGPEDLNLQPLKDKIGALGVKEVVIATDPDTEGEMTAIHITNELRPTGVKVTRIGLGIPVGSSVEYADISTLTMSLTARREIH
ncbi:MAG TPA: recombination mediator RecR [Candidatus Omnitrophota bacterium]|nr:recombination mediator RecR [Candidatus Omnitrophota bacterium]